MVELDDLVGLIVLVDLTGVVYSPRLERALRLHVGDCDRGGPGRVAGCGVLAFMAVSFCFGFVCAVVSRQQFWLRIQCWVFCAVVSFLFVAKFTIFLEIDGDIENLDPPACRVWQAFRVY